MTDDAVRFLLHHCADSMFVQFLMIRNLRSMSDDEALFWKLPVIGQWLYIFYERKDHEELLQAWDKKVYMIERPRRNGRWVKRG